MRSKLLLLVPMLALALSACAPSLSASQTESRTLSVNGTGTVYLTPDVAYIYIGVRTEDADIAESVARNNAQAQRVVDALRNSGVAAKDIQTSNFSVWTSQQYDPATGQQSGSTYVVENTVYVTVRELTKLGELLDTAIGAGANNINSIQFDVSDKTAALTEARQKAVVSANSLAGELAGLAGVRLGDIQTISYMDYQPMPYYGYGMGGGGGAAVSAEAAPINPGQIAVSVNVSIVYEIK
ncbi:MAG: SIMPL domain-containing protein [Anaerolineales bacterium]|nr:SIMPL domain-containing protein [Anaerolineales bacterium]